VVLLTSGYNNCPRTASAAQAKCVLNGTGDGQGYLYVLNAGTGVQITGSPILAGTGVGSVSTPSGLTQIAAHADSNNVSRRVYGGDLLGNLWRFSIEPGSFGSHRLANLKDGDGNIQPISVRPLVTTVNGSPVVYVGTGRYLGSTDVGITPKPKNSLYGIKDDLTTTTTYNNPRTYSSFIGQLAVPGICPSGTPVTICKPLQVIRTVTQTAGSAGSNLTTQNGWYLDFPANAGEIQFTDPRLVLGTLAFSTSVPTLGTSAVCTGKTNGTDGDALGYMLDYLTGGAVGTTSGVIATNLGAGIATAPQITQLPNGTVIAKYRLSTGQEVSVPLRFGSAGGATRRISWRELVSE
jgi:type IV pilus assembly protein PilY1